MINHSRFILAGTVAAAAAFAALAADNPRPDKPPEVDPPEVEARPASRAERRRTASAERKGLVIPAALDTRRPGWDRRLLALIDRVYVDGVHVPQCVAYSVLGGWALPKGGTEVRGEVTITRKGS